MNKLHTFGIILAVVIHGALGGGAYAAYEVSDQREYPCSDDTLPDDEAACAFVGNTFRVIEATLAMKKEDKSSQPQKKRARKKFRDKRKLAVNRDMTRKPKKNEDVSDDDIKDILKKNRKDDEEDMEDDLEEGKPAPKTTGQFHGHKHGFAEVSKGDPYLQKLAADVYNRWKVPTLETGKGVSIGCIRIQPDGGIKETKLRSGQKSGNQRFDASVTIALKKLQKFRNKKKNKKEVPTHLSGITTEWLCFKFRKKAD